jgi:hypothetical protein
LFRIASAERASVFPEPCPADGIVNMTYVRIPKKMHA